MKYAQDRSAGIVGFDDSIVARVARSLADRIIRGELAAGVRLRQDHLAEEFAVSHVPIREAFRVLEAQGLVVSKARCGVRVSHLDPGAVLELTEMRAALEGLALQHALTRHSANDLEAASQALAESEASDEIAEWEAANRRFHLAITAPCGMPRLMAAIGDLHRSDARYLFATWQTLDWRSRSDSEHRAILDALERGNGERARMLLEAHIRAAGQALAQLLHQTDAGTDAA